MSKYLVQTLSKSNGSVQYNLAISVKVASMFFSTYFINSSFLKTMHSLSSFFSFKFPMCAKNIKLLIMHKN